MQKIMLSLSFEMIIMISTIFSRYHVYEQKDLMNLNAVFIGVLYIIKWLIFKNKKNNDNGIH